MENFKQELFKEVAVQLKNARLNKGLSQRDLAEICNSTQVVINNVENSKVTPSLATLVKLCECLDLKINLTYSDGSEIKPPLLDSKERAMLRPLVEYFKKNNPKKNIVVYRNDMGDELIFYAEENDSDLNVGSIIISKYDFPNLNVETDYTLEELGL